MLGFPSGFHHSKVQCNLQQKTPPIVKTAPLKFQSLAGETEREREREKVQWDFTP